MDMEAANSRSNLNHLRNRLDKWFIEHEMYPKYPLGDSVIVIPLLFVPGIGGVGYYGTAAGLFGAVVLWAGLGMWASKWKES